MVKFFNTLDEMKKEISEINKEIDLDQILRIDLFYRESR